MNTFIGNASRHLWAIVLLIVLSLIWSDKTMDPDVLVRFMGISVFVCSLCFYLLLHREKFTLQVNPMISGLYFAFVIYTAFRISSSVNPGDGLFDWLKIFSGFILFILLAGWMKNIRPEEAIAKSLTVLSLILGVSGAYALFQIIITEELVIPLSTYQVSPFFGHRNLYCQMLFLSFPFSLALIFSHKSRIWKILSLTAYTLSLYLLIVLSNRASWLALAAGVLTLGIISILKKKGKTVIRKNGGSTLSILVLTALSLGFAMFILINNTNVGSLKVHTQGMIDVDQGSAKDRVELWKRTVQMIEEKPLFGQGPGNWKIEVLKYGNKGLVSENNNTFYQRPHNDFLWILSEYGAVGFLLFAAIWILIIIFSLRIVLADMPAEDVLFYRIMVSLIPGFLIFSFFSFPRERAETVVFAALLMALIVNRHDVIRAKNRSQSKPGRIVFLSAIIVFSVATLVVLQSRYTSEIHMKKALFAKENNNYGAVIREINRAYSWLYPLDPFSTPLPWYRGSANFNLNKTDAALKDFEEAYRMNPYHVHVLNNLASSYELKGQHDQAVSFYRKALAVAPNFEDGWLNLCAVYFNLGQIDSAYQALNEVDINTKNQKYPVFVNAVLKAQFRSISQSSPLLQPWFNRYNTNPENYLEAQKFSKNNNIKIFTIFTDTILLKKIYNSKNAPQ